MASQSEQFQQVFGEIEALERSPTNGQKMRALELLIEGLQSGKIQVSNSSETIDSIILRLRDIQSRLKDIDTRLKMAGQCGAGSTSIH